MEASKPAHAVVSLASLQENVSGGPLSFIRAAVASARIIGDGGKQRFEVLAKIVKHLKQKFLDMEDEPSSIDELLTDINETDIAADTKKFLVNEALPSNPKVTVTEDQKYIYKPPLPCRDKKTLLRYLKLYKQITSGGILKDDIIDSVPCAESILRSIAGDGFVTVITRFDKKEIIFFNDRSLPTIEVDESFKELYHSIRVDNLELERIEAYLRMNKVEPLMEMIVVPTASKGIEPQEKIKKRITRKPRDNVHVADDLQNYIEGLDDQLISKLSQRVASSKTKKKEQKSGRIRKADANKPK